MAVLNNSSTYSTCRCFFCPIFITDQQHTSFTVDTLFVVTVATHCASLFLPFFPFTAHAVLGTILPLSAYFCSSHLHKFLFLHVCSCPLLSATCHASCLHSILNSLCGCLNVMSTGCSRLFCYWGSTWTKCKTTPSNSSTVTNDTTHF